MKNIRVCFYVRRKANMAFMDKISGTQGRKDAQLY